MSTINKTKAIEILKNLSQEVHSMKNLPYNILSPKYIKWKRNLLTTLNHISANISLDNKEINKIIQDLDFSLEAPGFENDFDNSLIKASAVLSSMIDEIKEYWEKDISYNNNLKKYYIHQSRIDELKIIKNTNFDLTKLIRYCEEINICFINGCLIATGMLARAIIDHVPPIFHKSNFIEVANNYGSKSFKHSMINLNNSFRNIADSFLHSQIRNKETLPNEIQVNFSQDIDVLLTEIVRILK